VSVVRRLAVVGALLCAGCVERALLVQSEPSGARLFVNGVPRGTTPATIKYVHDGRFDVRVEKAGYQSVATEVVTRTRLDAVPGPDFVAENLWPGKIRRHTRVSLVMPALKARPGESFTKEELRAFVDQGRAFRERAKAAAAEPGTPRPTPPGRRSSSPQPFSGQPPAVR
jgi:hypothetical protein